MIYFQPHNHHATNLLNRALAAVDGRLSIPEDELQDVVATLLAQSHKPICLPAHKKITDALLGEVIGRDSGRATFFVKPDYQDPEAQWATKDMEPNFPFPPRTKGNAWFRTTDTSRTITWDEIAGIGFSAAYFIAPVDLEATVGAFKAGARPSVSFTACDHPKDPEGALAFCQAVSEGAKRQGIALAQIADGWVCADPQRSLMLFHSETNRFFNSAGLRFCFVTRDRYGRQETAWGAYQ